MAFESQERVIMAHSAAIVYDADHTLPARLHLNAHRVRARIERVFEQLLHHRCRPLHDLARRNTIGDRLRQYAYAAHELLIRIPNSSSCSGSTSEGASAIKSCAAVV